MPYDSERGPAATAALPSALVLLVSQLAKTNTSANSKAALEFIVSTFSDLSMHHIIYISSATLPLTQTDLEALLQRWRANNKRDGVTGILLYNESEGGFMQIIEGEMAIIKTLFGKIEKDYLHRSILKLADGTIRRRNFGTWRMGFKRMQPAYFTQLQGYIDPNGPALHAALADTHDDLIRHLVETFTTDHSAPMPVG